MVSVDKAALAVPDFGRRDGEARVFQRPGSGEPSFGGVSASDLGDWLRDCHRAVSRSAPIGDGSEYLQSPAPWAGGRRSLAVWANEGEDGQTVGARLLGDDAFVRRLTRDGDVADPLTVVSDSGSRIGPDLRSVFEAEGHAVRVYESTTGLHVVAPGTDLSWPEGGLRHRDGGFFAIHGQLSGVHDQALAVTVARAVKTRFRFASSATPSPGTKIGANDWAGTVKLLAETLSRTSRALQADGTRWDLAVLT
ncbi:hypothetical protein ACFQZ8_02715 [Micromonospora azadirachtae]|uniref:Uncharacterized protein n=1 Tax=Micromonospora azadirachtae TaxID=1970735 RepID=A0ABW2ZW19_9ACTN